MFHSVQLTQSEDDKKYGQYTNQYRKSVQQNKTIWNLDAKSLNGTTPPPNKVLPINMSLQKNPEHQYVVPQISSLREPYYVQYMTNGYGALQTRLGTQMGV